MLRTPRVLLIVALLIVSVATLAQLIFGTDNKLFYGIATTVSHVALVIVGSTYARGMRSKKNDPDNI